MFILLNLDRKLNRKIKSDLISYRHIKNGFQIDRFGFLVSDGVNANIFVLENSNQVSTVQIFTIYIDGKINLPPKIEKNLGIDYLQLLDNSTTGRLIAKNLSAKAYHAGLKNTERDEIQDEWMIGKTKIIVATISFGMGVDNPHVRFVAHWNLSKSMAAYYQVSFYILF